MSLKALILAAAAIRCSFPGVNSECWALIVEWSWSGSWMECRAREGWPGEMRPPDSSGLDVFWSPMGHHVAITDAAGSDNADALLWRQLGADRRSFEEDLRRLLGPADIIWQNHH
jgi:hypothetical protein